MVRKETNKCHFLYVYTIKTHTEAPLRIMLSVVAAHLLHLFRLVFALRINVHLRHTEGESMPSQTYYSIVALDIYMPWWDTRPMTTWRTKKFSAVQNGKWFWQAICNVGFVWRTQLIEQQLFRWVYVYNIYIISVWKITKSRGCTEEDAETHAFTREHTLVAMFTAFGFESEF